MGPTETGVPGLVPAFPCRQAELSGEHDLVLGLGFLLERFLNKSL